MNDIQARLKDFAKSKALPYLLDLDIFKPYTEEISFVLVGSAATGLCRPNSDVDIAIICEKEIYDIISLDKPWKTGRPTEVYLDGIQLHYYAITYDIIESKLKELDDIYLYVYSNVEIIFDKHDTYRRKLSNLLASASGVRNERLEGKLDMLLRRSHVLYTCFDHNEDLLSIFNLCIEIITITLKVIALLDNVQFDSRKRLFLTALQGVHGQKLEEKVRSLLSSLGEIVYLKDNISWNNLRFVKILNEIIEYICMEVENEGLKVGLKSVDRRHIEK